MMMMTVMMMAITGVPFKFSRPYLLITEFSEERSAEGGDQTAQCQRVVRIVTKDLPRYFATVTRCRLETATIGPAGAVLSSTVDSQVQAVFPEGALMKSIKVGLQVGYNDHMPQM